MKWRSRLLAAVSSLLLAHFPAILGQGEVDNATNWAAVLPPPANGDLTSAEENASSSGPEVRFVSRPDIVAHRWKIDVYDEDALAPGYWFVAPYRLLNGHEHDPWIGPTIYDGKGSLVWSGAPLFDADNVFDFRPTKVNGEDMLSLIAPWGLVRKNDQPGFILDGKDLSGIILDDSYQLHQAVDVSSNGKVDIHEFYVRDNGRRAIVIGETYSGFDNDSCFVLWHGFRELDLRTGKTVFDWDALGRIPKSESALQMHWREEVCKTTGFDVLHPNSVDKFANGDYLVSMRHSDTLYRISHKDGSIVWRLGGNHSNFVVSDGAHFTGQHHARIHSENRTHIEITLINNAVGGWALMDGRFSSNSSSGLLLVLHTQVEPMTAQLVSAYHHPEGSFTIARGSLHYLSNGNAFIGWAQTLLMSEHAADGRLLMQAKVYDNDTNTYRAYKYPWTGRPRKAPDVCSSASIDEEGFVSTKVYASWNGATEVTDWVLIHSNGAGEQLKTVVSAPRQGFETILSVSGLLEHVIVAALDVHGAEIGMSAVSKTLLPSDILEMSKPEQASWRFAHAAKPTDRQGWLRPLELSVSLAVVACFVVSRQARRTIVQLLRSMKL